MCRILRHGLRFPWSPEESTQVFPRSVRKFSHTSDSHCCRGYWSQIWHCTHIIFDVQFRSTATHYQHMIPLQTCHWIMYTHFVLHMNKSFWFIRSIFSSSLKALNLLLPAHTECHLSDSKLLGAPAAHPTRTQLISDSMLDRCVKATAKMP